MQLFGDTIDALRSAADLDELVARTAQRVKRLSGFDRVMVYRFDDEWNGHVIADAHEAGMASFHDLHYPASDIPAQARELYRSNLVRTIADVGYTPVPVLPWLDSEGQPLDMSHATLRSVSPMHLRYLQNMGVASTLTVSLLVDGRLWGLIACHHRTPRYLPVRLRRACHALSVTAGYMVAWHEQRQSAAQTAILAHARTRIVEAFNQMQVPLAEVVEQASAALLRIGQASGGALWRDGSVLPFGQWPVGAYGETILGQARRALETSTLDIWHTEATVAAFDPPDDGGAPLAPAAPSFGFMAVRLDAFAASGIVWLRPEHRREVTWGGDPDKAVLVSLDADGRPVLGPRTSFARWLTVVRGRCRPWTEVDTAAARSLQALVAVLTVRDSLAQVGLSDRRFRSLVALQSDAYCQLDVNGAIVTLSKPLPTGPGPVEGRALTALFAPHCDGAEVAALDQALRSLQPFRDLRLHGRAAADQAEFFLSVSGEPLSNPDGICVGWHGTLTDSTSEVAVQTALRLKEAAELSNLVKSKFLSQMSHELRTPLNAVLGFSQLLLLDGTLSQGQRDKLRHIQRAGDWLLEMIADLMDLSQIETGHLTLKLEAVDLRAVIAETLDLVESQAAAGDIQVVNDHEGPPAWVHADRSRLKQVLLNLASNALKYNRTRGDLHVAVRFDPALGTTSVALHDSGVGLSAAQIAQLFQPFNRLGREKQNIQGTGIGLVIARQLVQAMGGHISVESRPGQGSTFSVTLADAKPRTDATEVQVPEPAVVVADRVVLYVGDDAGNVVLMQSIVQSLPGVRLVHAETAERALELARDLHPAAVLIDIKLSGLPGMHVLKSIKADPAMKHLRCIAIDASAAGEALDELSLGSFEDRWPRPLDLKMIWSGLNAVLAR
jgi:light-regulated signal transduction histidine kinase (bacteriophytochrome)/CheY-like chemotaxis protein